MKKTIQQEIDETEKRLTELKQKKAEEENKNEWIIVPGTNYEVEKNVHHKNKSYDDLKSEFGEEYLKQHLISLWLLAKILENKDLVKTLKMDSSSSSDDFFIKQPIPQNEAKGRVADFVADSGDAVIYCDRNSRNSYSYRGVRFAREISAKSVSKKK